MSTYCDECLIFPLYYSTAATMPRPVAEYDKCLHDSVPASRFQT